MKAKTCGACLACITLGIILSGLLQPRWLAGQEKNDGLGRVKWEYKVLVPSEERLNVAGDAGWELVAIEHRENIGNLAYFKRPKM